MTRRDAVQRFWWMAAGSPLAAQHRTNPYPERTAPLEELVSVPEVEDAARRRLDRAVYEHIAAGVGGELTVRRNRDAFDRITFRPRVLVNVTEMDLSTELFGEKLYAPILVAPTAHHQRLHPEGEAATVQGAGAARTVSVISRDSSLPLEQIKGRATAPLWFQTYPESEPARLRESVRSAVAAGCKAICLTVGTPYEPAREPRVRHRPHGGAAPKLVELGARHRPDFSWDVLQQLKQWSTVPILVKGILSPEDAGTAVAKGADGVIVSNHGGRVVDGVPATIEVLPRVVEAVGSRAPVLVDSGFRRGTDILKALALGARAVLLGRPVLWGLAAYGADGVRAVLEMLHTELALAMGLSGKPNLAAVDRNLVKIHRR